MEGCWKMFDRTVAKRRITAAAIMVFMWTAAVNVWAQSSAPRQLTLIQSDDPQFDTLLTANFPALQNTDGFSAISPFLIFLRNDTAHVVRAYSIKWDIQTGDGVKHPPRFVWFIQKHFMPLAERMTLNPGEFRLIAPIFINESPQEYMLQRGRILKSLAEFAAQSPYSWSDAVIKEITIDAVIYDDGGYTGSDEFQLLSRYQALRDAERDEASSVRQVFPAGAPDDSALLSSLYADIQNGFNVDTSPTKGPGSLYAQEYALNRGTEAQMLLNLYKRGGAPALQTRVQAMANRHREQIKRID